MLVSWDPSPLPPSAVPPEALWWGQGTRDLWVVPPSQPEGAQPPACVFHHLGPLKLTRQALFIAAGIWTTPNFSCSDICWKAQNSQMQLQVLPPPRQACQSPPTAPHSGLRPLGLRIWGAGCCGGDPNIRGDIPRGCLGGFPKRCLLPPPGYRGVGQQGTVSRGTERVSSTEEGHEQGHARGQQWASWEVLR